MDRERFIKNLLATFVYWRYELYIPFQKHIQPGKANMSLEDYFDLQILAWFHGMTMNEYAKIVEITKQQATVRIQRLCDAGYVERKSDEKDRRKIHLLITEKASEEVNAFYKNAQGFVDILQSKLTVEEMAVFHSSVEHLLRILPRLEESPSLRLKEDFPSP